jgi:DNA replication protein DnaC
MIKRPVRTVISQENLGLIGVPKRLRDLTINDFQTYDNEALGKVKNYITFYLEHLDAVFLNCEGLCLFGSNGVGKTFIASMIVKEAYIHRYTAKRTTFVEYVTEYTRLWGAKTTEEKEQLEDLLYNNFKAVEFLVLEEVGKEIDSKASAPILEDLLRYREDKGLVTIMCSNVSPKTIEEKYGSSIASLMKGNMTPIKIEGEDKRQEFFIERTNEE